MFRVCSEMELHMKTGEADCRFPVLGFTTDRDIWGFLDLNGLTTCGPLTLKDDMQAGMELVDADGRRWVVRSIRRLGPAKSGLKGLVEPLLFGKRTSRIEHELEALAPLSLADVQARACDAMAAHPDFWCEDDERDTVLPARQAEVRSTTTIEAIHELLGLDSFHSY